MCFSGWSTFDKYPRTLCDVNGDGKDDIVGFGDDYVYVSFSNGTGFEPKQETTNEFTIQQGSFSS